MMAHGSLMLSDLRAANSADEMYGILCRTERELLKTL